MNKLINIVLVLFSLAGFAVAGYAEDNTSYQAEAIAKGKFADAEQGLLAILAENPNDPYALLNLAFVYNKTGDNVKAQDTYNKILTLKANPYADLASGKSESVKTVARRGIAKLAAE